MLLYYARSVPAHMFAVALEIVSLRVVTQPAAPPPATRSAAAAVRQPNPLHSAHAEQQ